MTIAASRIVSIFALFVTLATCTPASADGRAFAGLASALEAVPGVAPRLSIGNTFRPCRERQPADGTILRAECPARRRGRENRLLAVARKAAGRDDPTAVHTRAIIDLYADDERGRALDRSITALRHLATLADHPAPVLADLASALIVRAERTQAPRDLLEAYETAEQALRHEPRNLAALYNRALALERYGLVDETAKDWRAYLAVDSRSRWADDVRRRLDALVHLPGPPAPPAADAPLPAYTAYAAADPQGARELGMDRLLGEWGEAIESGDTARAADRLARAAALGEALIRRPGGDASLADMVRAVRAAGGSAAAARELARAHREYAAAIPLYEDASYSAAARHFAAAASAAEGSPILRTWARVFLGTARVIHRALEEGKRILSETVQETDAARHPALAARGLWSFGNTLGRDEDWEQGLELALQSARLFAAAGERENQGAALGVVTAARFVLGEPDSAYRAMHRSLDCLRPYRQSIRLHTVLTSAARHLETDGLFAPAATLQNESVGASIRSGSQVHVVEARAARARLAAGRGDSDQARKDVDEARDLVATIPDTVVRGWMAADLREVDALVFVSTNPARAARALDSAAAFFQTITIRSFPYLVRGAEARLTVGDVAGAVERLEIAIRLLDQRRGLIRIEPRRAAVYDAARGVVDRIVMLKLRSGHVAEALDYMDRSRASLAAAGAPSRESEAGVSAPPGEVLVEYALVRDTLLAWTVRGSSVEVFQEAIDTVSLIRTIEDVEARLQRGAAEAEVRPLLAALYESLMRPLEPRLGRSNVPLVIVAEGALASVPFAALYDTRRARYLVEDRPTRFAVSLREARRRPGAETAPGVLLVTDPAFDHREHPLLERLQAAAEERRALANEYPGAVVLEGLHASAAALRAALERSGVAHFAGHAVFDDERPEQSYLVLAPRPGASGRMTAEELSRLDLRHVRLVVLAACRTVRSSQSRAGGFTGLSGALLAAGAGGAVGSTWDVNDRSTSVLMAEFHRHYRRSRDGPRALRDAQLVLLRSGEGTLRTPAAWAGFRYAGW